jgi:hypothetical protein
MELKDNPLLQPEDFLGGYRESIEELKNRPELVQFDKICYELFSSELGKKFMEYVTENYLIPPLCDRNSPHFDMAAVWAEGFKDFPRMLRSAVQSHNQRIKAEVNK